MIKESLDIKFHRFLQNYPARHTLLLFSYVNTTLLKQIDKAASTSSLSCTSP